MSGDWTKDGSRWRLACGKISVTVYPGATDCDTRWYWRIDVGEGFGTLGHGDVLGSAEAAKEDAEKALGVIADYIERALSRVKEYEV